MISSKLTIAMTTLILLVIGFVTLRWISSADRELLEAVNLGGVREIESALRKGANVDVRDFDLGSTPLLHASRRGALNVVVKLVESGANIDAKDGGGSPLYWACFDRREAVANYLHSVNARLISD